MQPTITYATPEILRPSRLGNVSLWLAIVAAVQLVGLVLARMWIIARALHASSTLADSIRWMVLLRFVALLAVAVALAGLICAIAALIRPRCYRGRSIAGLVISALTLVALVLMA